MFKIGNKIVATFWMQSLECNDVVFRAGLEILWLLALAGIKPTKTKNSTLILVDLLEFSGFFLKQLQNVIERNFDCMLCFSYTVQKLKCQLS